jgi:hypothetical protein
MKIFRQNLTKAMMGTLTKLATKISDTLQIHRDMIMECACNVTSTLSPDRGLCV